MAAGLDGSRRTTARRSRAASALAGAALLALSSCSVNDAMRPSVDVGMQTATVPATPVPAAIVPPAPIPDSAAPAMSAAAQPAPPLPAASAAPPVSPAPAASGVGAPTQDNLPVLTTETPVQTAAMITPPPMPEPEPAPAADAKPAARGMQVLVPSNPMMVSYPRPTVPQEPGTVMPKEEIACRQRLNRLGVTYQDLAPIDDGGACKIEWPVKVSGLSGNIEMSPPATLNCQMAETFARWTRNELAPAARTRYLTGIGRVRQGSSYSCRRIAGTRVMSEHAKGNALDVMSVELKNGREIDVRKPGFFAFRQRGLLNTVRAEGCDYFTTVLGPGYNYDHRDHFHFDLKGRRNGYRACR